MQESKYNIWIHRVHFSYVFNTSTSGFFRLSHPEFEALQSFIASSQDACISPQLLLKLVENRVIIPENADEVKWVASRYHSTRHHTPRLGLTIVTSLGCNFGCPYCFEDKHGSILQSEVQMALLQFLDEKIEKLQRFEVCWFGGEPLLGKEQLLALSDQFIERCDRAGVTYVADIITNGYLLDEQTCDLLRKRRVATAQITLDGPPEVHDLMRPLVNGKGTFKKILANIHHAVNYLSVSIRVNLSQENTSHVEKLLQILQAEGLSDKLHIYPGQIVAVNDGASAPSASYSSCCLSNIELAKIKLEFMKLAQCYGFDKPSLPKPVGTPCTAVRSQELIVGSKGELYKCPYSVGNPQEVIGHISDYKNCNTRLHKWLNYDPFTDPECTNCIALPVCMGGCAHHAMDPVLHDNRCDSFRHNYKERILAYIEAQEASQGA